MSDEGIMHEVTKPGTEAGVGFNSGFHHALATVARTDIDGLPYLVLPSGVKVETLEHLLAKPRAISESVEVADADSFAVYFDRFSESSATIFATHDETRLGDPCRITAVLDYHTGPLTRVNSGSALADLPLKLDAVPSWCNHRVELQAKVSEDFTLWALQSGRLSKQRDFSEFIESNLHCIVQPAAAELLEVVTSLEATQNVEFKSAERLQDGARQFRYEHTTKAKAGQQGSLEIPGTITLALPVFAYQDPVEVTALFRYRIEEDGLRLGYLIPRLDRVKQAGFDTICDQVAAATGRTPLRGQWRTD
jgi:hypothetical protein